jgi:uncharacterized membrane protein
MIRVVRGSRAFDVATLLVLAGTAALTASLYGALPERIPTHFGLSGYANDWMRRDLGAWLMPGIALVAWGVVRFAAAWCPGEWRDRAVRSPMAAGAFLLVALLACIQGTILWASFHPGASIGRGLALTMGAYLLALSAVMPRIRRNPVMGIRAWTLASDENWARTHRFASYTLGAAGVVALAGAVLAGSTAAPVAIVALLLGALAPAVYSYVVARGEA